VGVSMLRLGSSIPPNKPDFTCFPMHFHGNPRHSSTPTIPPRNSPSTQNRGIFGQKSIKKAPIIVLEQFFKDGKVYPF